VIERITQRLRNRLRKGEKLVVRCRIAGAEAFRHAAGAHRAPFVVIALEPDLEKIRELAILCDVLRWEMAVVVQDWLARCIRVKQPLRSRGLEKKVVVYKTHQFFGRRVGE
jgi:hypothetical protein